MQDPAVDAVDPTQPHHDPGSFALVHGGVQGVLKAPGRDLIGIPGSERMCR
jgi:hypothetical protein